MLSASCVPLAVCVVSIVRVLFVFCFVYLFVCLFVCLFVFAVLFTCLILFARFFVHCPFSAFLPFICLFGLLVCFCSFCLVFCSITITFFRCVLFSC